MNEPVAHARYGRMTDHTVYRVERSPASWLMRVERSDAALTDCGEQDVVYAFVAEQPSTLASGRHESIIAKQPRRGGGSRYDPLSNMFRLRRNG